jgi:hypothetical protein
MISNHDMKSLENICSTYTHYFVKLHGRVVFISFRKLR